MAWGEEFDEELKNEVEVGFRLGFKSMSFMIDRIVEETKEYDEKHPKDSLISILLNDLLIILVLVVFSYNILMIVTVFFMLFYGYILIQLGKAWKRFNYPMGQYRLMSIGGLLLVIVLGIVIQSFIF